MNQYDVNCNSCLKEIFSDRRYKCLICYNYDLCSSCYDTGSFNVPHVIEHPVQCILTQEDFLLYYEGETANQIQAYTCPYCNRMGFTFVILIEHVTSEHRDIFCKVGCPVCASIPGPESNLMTNNLAIHLILEHRSGLRDLSLFVDDLTYNSHNERRLINTIWGVTAPDVRSLYGYPGELLDLFPSSDYFVDPFSELLSQLYRRRHITFEEFVGLQSNRSPRHRSHF